MTDDTMPWCVGACLGDGRHEYAAFDTEAEARAHAAHLEWLGDRRVFVWEM